MMPAHKRSPSTMQHGGLALSLLPESVCREQLRMLGTCCKVCSRWGCQPATPAARLRRQGFLGWPWPLLAFERSGLYRYACLSPTDRAVGWISVFLRLLDVTYITNELVLALRHQPACIRMQAAAGGSSTFA
jgi:hypothetical protein